MSNKVCKIDGCEKTVHCGGVCQMHYRRFKKNGDYGPPVPVMNSGLVKQYPQEHRAWQGAKGRCLNPNDKAYKSYGGRGIRVCEQWARPDGFYYFLQDMGPKPHPEYSLDRIDVNGDYCPENCRWTTPMVQSVNRRFKSKYSDRAGVYYHKDGKRIRRWSAVLQKDGRTYKAGPFKTQEEAIIARKGLERKFFGYTLEDL